MADKSSNTERSCTNAVTQFADDNPLVCTDYKSIRQVFVISDRFCNASGAKLNKDKCRGLWLGAWKNNQDKLCNISWSNDVEKMVGVHIGNGDYMKVSWDTAFKKFEKVVADWQNWFISMKGKAVILNTLALSKLTYIGSVIPMPKGYYSKINTVLFQFIWGNKPEAVARNVLLNKCVNGGIGLLDIKVKLQALQVMHLREFIFGTEAKWQHFARYWVGLYLRKYNPQCDSNRGPHASPENIPVFYQEALEALSRLFEVQPDFDLKAATCRTVYFTLLKPDKPKVETKFPLVPFSTTWQNLNSSFLDPVFRETAWRIAHQVLPIGEHLYFKGISKRLKCYFCYDWELFSHLFWRCDVVHPLIKWIEDLMEEMLHHWYSVTAKAMVFCDIVPTGI